MCMEEGWGRRREEREGVSDLGGLKNMGRELEEG